MQYFYKTGQKSGQKSKSIIHSKGALTHGTRNQGGGQMAAWIIFRVFRDIKKNLILKNEFNEPIKKETPIKNRLFRHYKKNHVHDIVNLKLTEPQTFLTGFYF